jgi:hypothetical protein
MRCVCNESFHTEQKREETIIQKEVDGIKKRSYLAILWMGFSIILIAFFQFVVIWFTPLGYPSPPSRAVYSCFSVVVYVIVGYLWVRFIKPEFHVHVMGKALAESGTSFLTEVFELQEPQNSIWGIIKNREKRIVKNRYAETQQEQKQISKKYRVQPQLLFVAIFISIGLVCSSLITLFDKRYYQLPFFYLYSYSNNLIPVGPTILVAVLAAAAFVFYRYFRKQMRSGLVVFLAIPTVLSSIVVLFQLADRASQFWNDLVIGSALPTGVVYDYAYIVAHVLVLGVSILLLIVICQFFFFDLTNFYTCISDDRVTGIGKIVALLPKRVRINSSHALFFCTKLSQCSEKSNGHFELELQARGIKFDGAKRATMHDRSHITTTAWNCCFPASGVQTINIVLNAVNGSNKHQILVHKHVVTVDNLFTASRLPVLVAVIPILTALIGALVH